MVPAKVKYQGDMQNNWNLKDTVKLYSRDMENVICAKAENKSILYLDLQLEPCLLKKKEKKGGQCFSKLFGASRLATAASQG